MSKFRVPQAFVVALEVAGLGPKLREPGLALEEARSDLRCCKNPTPESLFLPDRGGRSRFRYGGKGTNPLSRECDI